MKRLIILVLAILPCLTAYVASPFLTAFMISEAVKAGDSDYLERKIEWPAVRQSLRESLTPMAVATAQQGTAPSAKPGLWARIKASFGRSAVNQFVDRYVTPKGLPTVFNYGTTYRKLRGDDEPPRTLANLGERMRKAWGRTKRAEFLSPTLVEIEMRSRTAPDRHYVSRLELQNFEWRLISLRVKQIARTDERIRTARLEAARSSPQR